MPGHVCAGLATRSLKQQSLTASEKNSVITRIFVDTTESRDARDDADDDDDDDNDNDDYDDVRAGRA